MYGHIEHLVSSAERVGDHTERVAADDQLGALAASISRSLGTLKNRMRFPIGRRRAMITSPAIPATAPLLEK